MVDSFKVGLKEGIKKASELGAQGIQIYAVSGEMALENLNSTKVKEIVDLIKSNGLEVSALCGDLGGHGFELIKDNKWKIEKSMRIMELARELDTNVVTTHIGVIPTDKLESRYAIMQEACQRIGEFGDKIEVNFAIETGPEPAAVLKNFVEGMNCRSVKVNFDPANLVMVTGDDPVIAAALIKDHIVHTHAKDGIMLKKVDPRIVYRSFAEGGIEGLIIEELFREVPLGEGQVNFDEYLQTLKNCGYDGYLTIEREVGEDPEKDIRMAVDFLKKKLAKLR